jgi:2-amino-4-hydroxy-6-hydroxymethyldihydropteridine diphosphokinase
VSGEGSSRRGTLAYVGLGSNLGERELTIRRAAELIGTRRLSTVRETEPWGVERQPRFLNAAAELETELPPRALLERLLEVEHQLGRIRDGTRYGPRTIDLDLLLYGSEEVDEPGLVVPHPHLHERAFALEPLAELDPRLVVPGRGDVASLLAGIQSGA